MHARHLLLFTTALVGAAAPALAADTLKFGKAPDWAAHQPVPAPPLKHKDAPLLVLLSDTQARVDGGKLTRYSEVAFKVQTTQGLAAGNISLPWSPDTDTVTVNKLEIRRGDQVIDVLASGQKFTTIRRESNLEAATLDGVLTANIQPEGLQVGDVIFLAMTQEHFDPVMKGHVEANFAAWNGTPIRFAHASLDWPEDVDLAVKQSAGLPTAKPVLRDGRKVLDMTARDVEPLTLPKDAPARFAIGRLAQASDYKSWAEVASLMKPLFTAAAVIPASGALHDEVEKIRTSSKDPKVRAEKALELVQSKVRYVALLMGQGSYVPANAETTWARRFGDCKAKTALLTAILRSFGIQADPVAVQSSRGDAVPSFLPMIGVFDHVLVRAQIGSKTYWLDGTRTGDKSLDDIVTPSFHWGLPLIENAALVPIMPEPLMRPDDIATLDIDASGGVRAPAPAKLELVVRGDEAVALNASFSSVTATEADQFIRENAKDLYDFTSIKSATFSYDETKREFRRTVTGEIKLNWRDGWYRVPHSGVGFEADYERPAGPDQDAPFAIPFPQYAEAKVSVLLPEGFIAAQSAPPPVDQTLAGVTYVRAATIAGNRFTLERSSRSIAAEVAYQAAQASVAKLKALSDQDVYLAMPDPFKPTPKDLIAVATDEPSSAYEYRERGSMYLVSNRYDDAIKDFTEAVRLDPKDVWALANRALAYTWTQKRAAGKKDAEAALAIESGNWVANEALGLIAEFDGHPTEAVEHFSQVLRTNPRDNFAMYHRATNALSSGKFDVAEKDIQAIKAIPGAAVAALPLEAQMMLAKGEFAEAVTAYTAMLGKNMNDAFVYRQRAGAYRALGQDDKALADTAAGLKLLPSDSDLRLMRINLLKVRGRNDEVAKEADLLIKYGPKDTFAYVAAARSYAAIGDRTKAMETFDKALTIKEYGFIYLNRAEVRPKDDKSGRTTDVQTAMRLDPQDPETLTRAARIFADGGQYAEALAALDKLGAVDSGNWNSKAERATLLAKLGKRPEAEALFSEAMAAAKTGIEFNSLCWNRATANVLLDQALASCKRAVELSPDTAAFVDSLGMAYLRLGKFEESVEAYNKALATRPKSAESLMGRALALAGKGDLAHARVDAKAAREQDANIDETFSGYGLKFEDQNKLTSK